MYLRARRGRDPPSPRRTRLDGKNGVLSLSLFLFGASAARSTGRAPGGALRPTMLLCVQSQCVLSLLCLVRCSEHLTLRADPTGGRARFSRPLRRSLSMEIVQAEREGPLGKWKGPRGQSQSNDDDQTRPFVEGRNTRLAEAPKEGPCSHVCWKSSRRGGGSQAQVRWTPTLPLGRSCLGDTGARREHFGSDDVHGTVAALGTKETSGCRSGIEVMALAIIH